MFELHRDHGTTQRPVAPWAQPSNGKARKPAPVRPSLFLRLLALLGL